MIAEGNWWSWGWNRKITHRQCHAMRRQLRLSVLQKYLVIPLIRNSQDKAVAVSSHWHCRCRIGPFPRNSGCGQLPNVVSSHFLASDRQTNTAMPSTPRSPLLLCLPVPMLYCQRGFPARSLKRSCVTIWLNVIEKTQTADPFESWHSIIPWFTHSSFHIST